MRDYGSTQEKLCEKLWGSALCMKMFKVALFYVSKKKTRTQPGKKQIMVYGHDAISLHCYK